MVEFYTLLAMLPQFYRSDAEFRRIHLRLKQYSCPHCRMTHTLILHGYLSGYDLKRPHRSLIRGHRIFCSNRNRRGGCGKTWSIMMSSIIKNFIIQTAHLWDFLRNIGKGMNIFQSFNILKIPFSPTSIYRLYKRVYENQHHIRSHLIRRLAPPQNVQHINPLVKTILHIESAFKRNSNAPAAFQYIFQRSFL
jgi:hypothetical protein